MHLRIKFLGAGSFAEPMIEVVKKRFDLVDENPDLQVVANYGRILTKAEIETPKFGTINVHPSCLPKYRGATPLQAAILHGDTTTCVCIIKMVERVDAGPILACEEIPIDRRETLETLSAKTAKLAAQILPLVILQYISGSINPRQQDESNATHVSRLTREDGLLDLRQPAARLERQIRAYQPWPGSFILLNKTKRLIIEAARVSQGRLLPERVQLEGKKPTSWTEFKRGYRGTLPAQLV